MSTKENSMYSKKYVEGIILKEIEHGGLLKMDNGNYCIGPRKKFNDGSYDFNTEFDMKMGSSNNSSEGSSPRHISVRSSIKRNAVFKKLLSNNKMETKKAMTIRVGERCKRAKKVFDPSENNLPSKRKRGRPVGSLNKTTIKKQYNSVSKISRPLSQKSKSDSIVSSNDDETNDHSFISDICSKGTGGICSVCRQYRSTKDNSEKLIECRDCSNKAHPSCLEGDGMLRLRPDHTWQCPHCKTCVICIETTDAGILTVCSICADAYHALCHTPPIPETLKAWNQWECKNCQEAKTSGQNIDSNYIEKIPNSDRSSKLSDHSDSIGFILDRRKDKSEFKGPDIDESVNKTGTKINKNEDENSNSSLSNCNSKWKYSSRKLTSPTNENVYDWKPSDDIDYKINDKENLELRKKNNFTSENFNSIYMNTHDVNKLSNDSAFVKYPNFYEKTEIDLSIPDISLWNHIDVYNYFLPYFPEHAHIFKDQQIDGSSLLVMRRCDVLEYLGLDLGPAVKIYRHIVKLQSRRDDIKMCWF